MTPDNGKQKRGIELKRASAEVGIEGSHRRRQNLIQWLRPSWPAQTARAGLPKGPAPGAVFGDFLQKQKVTRVGTRNNPIAVSLPRPTIILYCINTAIWVTGMLQIHMLLLTGQKRQNVARGCATFLFFQKIFVLLHGRRQQMGVFAQG